MEPEWEGDDGSYEMEMTPGMCLPFLEGIRDGWDDVSPTESADLSLSLFKDDESLVLADFKPLSNRLGSGLMV